ncbi:MAG: hypothetical protein OZSIB_3580 [Candidatus Ozemobacter sibiricus]|jgi:hypothetical protein|uniref:Tetratricopeptide repeat protein n=1 Tax=Candidatus Ozemobacter sibiricus TaxID=2268124 RepID=A0A367ZPV3_9BACT|nr:MAG: hypothetical protein OZSIB_3580 [Candidatus Ozemobacter sibiricus]
MATGEMSRSWWRARPAFWLALLWCLAFTVQWTTRAWHWQALSFEAGTEELTELVLEAVPMQVRRLGADFLWLRADEYMHFGPSRRYRGAFLAGTYAGNTEILPLLELAIRLDPTHFEAYAILAQNLAFHLDRFVPAVRLLQRGILHNQHHPFIHELYGTIAYCLAFVKSYDPTRENNRVAALRYLDEALAAFARAGLPASAAGEVLNPINYQIWRARFLVEQGRPDAALQAWVAAGQPLGPDGGLLGEYLGRVALGQPVPALPEELRPHLKDGGPPVGATADASASAPDRGGGPAHAHCSHGPGEPCRADRAPDLSLTPRAGTEPTGPARLPSEGSPRQPAGEPCNHEDGSCPHQKAPPPLFDRNHPWLATYLQMLVLGGGGLLLLWRGHWSRR